MMYCCVYMPIYISYGFSGIKQRGAVVRGRQLGEWVALLDEPGFMRAQYYYYYCYRYYYYYYYLLLLLLLLLLLYYYYCYY